MTEAAFVGTPSINSFFKIQESCVDIPVAAADVENANTAEEANFKSCLPQSLQEGSKHY